MDRPLPTGEGLLPCPGREDWREGVNGFTGKEECLRPGLRRDDCKVGVPGFPPI